MLVRAAVIVAGFMLAFPGAVDAKRPKQAKAPPTLNLRETPAVTFFKPEREAQAWRMTPIVYRLRPENDATWRFTGKSVKMRLAF